MNTVITAAHALLRSRDRATSILTVVAFALPHAMLLAVSGGVIAFQQRAAHAHATDASIESVYVLLAYFAATLLIVPILTMGAAAARLGMSRRASDLAILRLIGLSPARAKLACVAETVLHAACGVIAGSILYAATLPAWSLISFQNKPMGAAEMWTGPLVLLCEGVLMMLLAAISSWVAMRRVAITPLGVARRSEAQKVSPIGIILIVLLFIAWIGPMQAVTGLSQAMAITMMLGFLLLIFALVNAVGVWSVRLMGLVMARCARRPHTLLAARRIIDDPKSVWRSFGSVALMGFLIGVLYPLFSSISINEVDDPESLMLMRDIGTGMLLTFALTLVLSTISTAVNQSIRVIDSTGQLQALSYMGSPRRFMDRSRRREIATPAFIMVGSATLLGLLFMLPVIAMDAPNMLRGVVTALLCACAGVLMIILASETTAPLRHKLLADLAESRIA